MANVVFLGAIGSMLLLAVGVAGCLVHRRAHHALIDGEREFRRLVEGAPDLISRHDRDGRIRYMNPCLERYVGVAMADALGKRPSVVWPGGRYRGFEQACQRAMADRAAVKVEVREALPDGDAGILQFHIVAERDAAGGVVGTIAFGRDIREVRRAERMARSRRFPDRIIDTKATPFTDPAERAFIVGIIVDLTERKQAESLLRARERQFRSLVENSPDAIIRYDRGLRRIYVNPAYEKVHGMPATDVVGMRVDECSPFPVDVAARYQTVLRTVIDSGKEGIADFEWVAPDGAEHCLHFRIVPEFDGDGAVVGALTIERDILPLRLAERGLKESRARLQELTCRREDAREDERRRIARDLHEELGQILTALRLNISSQRVQFGHSDPRLVERIPGMLDLVDKAIGGMRNVVSMLRPTALDAGIAVALAWQAREFTRLTGIPCTTELDDEDAIQLPEPRATVVFRIVQEALTNIVRHADARQVVVRLMRAKEELRLEVVDDGRGFDLAASREKSFGLLDIWERAQMLGGRLDIASSAGAGTALAVRFPA